MVTDQAFHDLRNRVIKLDGQVAFLYEHLGITFVPETQVTDDPRIIEQLQKGNLIEAIKIHRQLNDSSLEEAKKAVEEMQGRLGI
jgi:ribosomal protein L7/L12